MYLSGKYREWANTVQMPTGKNGGEGQGNCCVMVGMESTLCGYIIEA